MLSLSGNFVIIAQKIRYVLFSRVKQYRVQPEDSNKDITKFFTERICSNNIWFEFYVFLCFTLVHQINNLKVSTFSDKNPPHCSFFQLWFIAKRFLPFRLIWGKINHYVSSYMQIKKMKKINNLMQAADFSNQ